MKNNENSGAWSYDVAWSTGKIIFFEQRVFNNNNYYYYYNNNNNNNNKNIEELVGQLFVLSKCLRLVNKTNKKKGDKTPKN